MINRQRPAPPSTTTRHTRERSPGSDLGRHRARHLNQTTAALIAVALAACAANTADSTTSPSTTQTQSTPSTPSTSSQWSDFGEFLRHRADADQFSGAVLVAHDGDPVVQAAYGLADRDAKVPNNIDTRFNIGSLGKMFTGVAIAQLVGQGRLSFNDTIGKYLSGSPDDIANNVTIDQLLTHTSGMGDFMRNGHPEAAKAAETATDLLPLIIDEPLLFEPGTRESYSNSGYVVLGAIIEAVSGHSYDNYVRAHIFDPAGMTSTDWTPPGQNMANTARGYMRVDASGRPLPPNQPGQSTSPRADNTAVVPWGSPAGGAYSTVTDLARFGEALLDGRLLTAQLTTTVLTGKVAIPGTNADTAYGFTDGSINGVRIVGHGGGAPGVDAAIDIYPDRGHIVVILANYDGVVHPVQDQTRTTLTA